jgi:ParB/RepB/Spo0J family partition protein
VPTLTKRRSTLADYEVATETMPAVDDRIVHQVPIADIRPSPNNPRHRLHGIEDLAASIADGHLLQPVLVRRRGRSGYELIAGHRRLEAVKLLGWTEIEAKIVDVSDKEAYILTLVENLQREDLTADEEAEALGVLVRERKWSVRKVAEAVKRSPMYVSRRLRVFDDEVLKPLVLRDERPLPVSTAEELLREPDVDARRELAHRAAREEWTPSIARREVAEGRRCNGPLQPASPRLASRIRALSAEVADIEPGALSSRVRRELLRFAEVVRSVTSTAR